MDRRAFVGAVVAGIMAAPLAEFPPLGAPRHCASVDTIGGTQAFTLGMRRPPALAALHLHAAVQRELRTHTAGLARVSRGARGLLLRHARWGQGAGGWL